MKNIYKKIGASFLFFIGAFCLSQAGGWTSVHADVTQSDSTAIESSGAQGTFEQMIDTHMSGTATAFTFYATNPGVWTTGANWTAGFVTLTECDNDAITESSGSGTSCNNRIRHSVGYSSSGTATSSGNFITITFPSGISMNPAKYYIFAYFLGSSNSTSVVQGTTASVGGRPYTVGSSACQPVCISLSSPYFLLTGATGGDWAPPVPPSTVSRIENISPAEGDVMGSTSVPISFDYYFNPSEIPNPVTSIDIVVSRTDAPEVPQTFNLTPITQNTLITGTTHTFTLTNDANYTVTFNLHALDFASVARVVPMSGVFSDFSVGSDPSISIYSTCDITSLAGCFQNVFTYLFRPSNSSINAFSQLSLRNKTPFSYVYDTGTIYNELFANTGSMEYKVQVSDGVFGTITFISASQISAVPYSSTIKTILEYLIYFFTAMTLYRLLLRVHDK